MQNGRRQKKKPKKTPSSLLSAAHASAPANREPAFFTTSMDTREESLARACHPPTAVSYTRL